MDKETLPFALPEHIKSGPAAYIQMSDLARSVIVQNADSLENGLLRPRHSKITRLGAGVFEGTLQAVKIPSALMMFGGKGLVAMGGAFGEESRVSEWGREMIRAGAREIDAKNKAIAKKSGDVFGLEDDEKETMSYAVGAGFGNMATILLAAYATGGKGGAVFAGAQEIAGETEKRMYAARAKGEDPTEISQGQAAKEFAATAAYGAAAGMLEKVNLGKIMPFLRTSKKWYVAALQSAVSEGTTEFAQSLAAMGFGLADGTIDFSRVPAEIYGALQEGVVGGIVGGTVGGAFSLKNRRDVKGMFRDRLRDTVPAQDLERVVDALYNASADTMAGIVVKELALSEELRNKHGEIYSAMLDAINKTSDASGAFADVSPDERQDYVQQTAAMFADQVLAEANKRQVAIDDVLTGAQIVFENGGIAFKNRDFTLTEDGVFEQAMYRSKIDNVGDFYDSVVKKEDSRPRYFSYTTKSGAELSLPDYIINHDINGHNLTRDDFETVFQNLENIEKISLSDEKTDLAKNSLLIKINTPSGSYGIAVALGKNKNYISTVFRSTGKKGADAWVEKGNAIGPTNNPSAPLGETPVSVVPYGHSLKDIISEVRKEINTPLEQRKAVRRGMYSQAENLIRLTKDADFSTLPHELAHFWLTEQETWANTKSASDEYVDAFNQALNWLGVKDGKTINRRAQEQFARGYEQYLLDGNLPRTPDSDILPTYQRYDRWLKRVYDAMNQPSKKPLTEEIIRFFQSMTTGSLPPTVLPVAASVPEREKDAEAAIEVNDIFGKERDYADLRKSAVEFYKKNLQGKVIEKDGLGAIRFSNKGLKEFMSFSADKDKILALSKIDEIIKTGKVGAEEAPKHPRKDDIVAFIPISNKIFVDGKVKPVEVLIAKDSFGNLFYDLFLDNKRNRQTISQRAKSLVGSAADGDIPSVNINISDSDAFVNRPSVSSPTVVRSDELSGAYWKPAAAQENANGKVSRAQERQNRLNRLNGLLSEDAVSTTYEAAHLADASQKAVNLIETRGIDAARKMIDGEVPTEDGVLRTALMIEYEQKMLAEGNVEEYTRVLRLHTLEQTRRGQEISAEKLNQDITNPAYWFKRVLLLRKNNLPKNIVANMPEAASLDGRIDKFVAQTAGEAARDIAASTTDAQIDAAIERVKKKVMSATGKQLELFQDGGSVAGRAYDAVYDEIARSIEDALDIYVKPEEANRILAKASELAGAVKKDFAENPFGNPSVETMRKIKEIKDLAASMSPTNAVSLAANSLGRANMLLSVKSTLLNVISNAETFLTESIVRRLTLKSAAKAVDPRAVRDYLKYDLDVYNASGVMMSVVRKGELDNPGAVFGERFMSSAGDGAFRAWTRKMEKVVFDWSLGMGDAVSKSLNFVDNANLEATKQAVSEGYTGADLRRRATELFADAVLYTPQTAAGARIRENSINSAEVATFTNKSRISEFSSKIRNLMNSASGRLRAGDLIMPFVATPANVVSLGMEYSFGAARALIPQNFSQIMRDVRTGVISNASKDVFRSAVRNGVGLILASVLAALIDPDDYISPFDLASQKEKDLVRFKNGVYNSIRIGGKYVSLDEFGPLASVLAGILAARKNGSIYEKAAAFAKTALTQAGNIPGIKETSELIGWLDKAQKQDAQKTAEDFVNGAFDQLLARTIPAVVSDAAKMLDDKERVNERGVVGAAAAKIPFARENLSAKTDLAGGRERRAENPLIVLLFGARVKTAASGLVAEEIERLSAAGQNIRLSDFTRSKEFKNLTAKGKAQARLDFAKGFTVGGLRVKGFSEQVADMMKSQSYGLKTDAQKSDAINGVTERILKRLKRKYRN